MGLVEWGCRWGLLWWGQSVGLVVVGPVGGACRVGGGFAAAVPTAGQGEKLQN